MYLGEGGWFDSINAAVAGQFAKNDRLRMQADNASEYNECSDCVCWWLKN